MSETMVVVTEELAGGTVDRWGRVIADAVEPAPRRLIVDLRACPLVDAAAIAILLKAHRKVVHEGGRLTLRGPTDRVRRILRLARVDQVFDIEDAQRPEAVGA